MANDSLKSLVANVPDWLKRLTELDGQIEQRQLDLANLPENQHKSSARSIRNRGSTESLKPKDDGAAYPDAGLARDVTPPPATRNGPQPPSTPGSEPKSGSSLLRQTNEVVATAQRRARATVRKRQKTDSMLSGEIGATPKYRTRRMIIVYYDSYVQSFFEELVKFVSAQRNLMRKAKMAAKVAEIKRLAELEMPDDEDDDDDDDNGELKPGNSLIAADPKPSSMTPKHDSTEELKLCALHSRPSIRNPAIGMRAFRGTRPGAFGSGLGIFKEKDDIWDELDKGLEFVQGMCEHAAHQFLRDGDCNAEIEKIKVRLAQTKEAAAKEMERQATEKPNGTEEEEPVRARSYRPLTMRRDAGASTPTKPPVLQPDMEVEDEGVQDMDDFKPDYKSARLMNGPLR
ncbi:hypothetical protein F5X96DRAFT_612597 [Biscogniauxia mediterranea]|nr:hypothetical protein F5X96DRAFT_612597 [Biscogniauxia mediterranea]